MLFFVSFSINQVTGKGVSQLSVVVSLTKRFRFWARRSPETSGLDWLEQEFTSYRDNMKTASMGSRKDSEVDGLSAIWMIPFISDIFLESLSLIVPYPVSKEGFVPQRRRNRMLPSTEAPVFPAVMLGCG